MNAHAIRWGVEALAELRAIPPRQIGNTVLFGLLATGTELLINLVPVMQFLHHFDPVVLLTPIVVNGQIRALVLLAALVLADGAVDRGVRADAAYVGAALAGCIVGATLGFAFEWPWRKALLPDFVLPMRPYQRSPLFWYGFYLLQWLLLGGSAALLYASRRVARRAQARLHAAEIERVRQSKRALESRLQAMQARVEPAFLLNTLAQAEQLYRSDPDRASRLMSELIGYLRAAMPLMRSSASTVGREVELVRNYLEIVRIRLGDTLRVEVDIATPAAALDARMPPMMLLPLVDHAIVRGLTESREGGTIGIRVGVTGDRVRLSVFDSGAGFVPESAGGGVDDIRERLGALFGQRARLELRLRAGEGTEAVLEIPYEASSIADELRQDGD